MVYKAWSRKALMIAAEILLWLLESLNEYIIRNDSNDLGFVGPKLAQPVIFWVCGCAAPHSSTRLHP